MRKWRLQQDPCNPQVLAVQVSEGYLALATTQMQHNLCCHTAQGNCTLLPVLWPPSLKLIETHSARIGSAGTAGSGGAVPPDGRQGTAFRLKHKFFKVRHHDASCRWWELFLCRAPGPSDLFLDAAAVEMLSSPYAMCSTCRPPNPLDQAPLFCCLRRALISSLKPQQSSSILT